MTNGSVMSLGPSGSGLAWHNHGPAWASVVAGLKLVLLARASMSLSDNFNLNALKYTVVHLRFRMFPSTFRCISVLNDSDVP